MSKGGDYEAIYKELDKLDALYGVPGKGAAKTKTKSIETSLDTLLASLRDAKRQLTSGEKSLSDVASSVTGAVEVSKKEIEDRQKEVYNSLNRLGKALDKVRRLVISFIAYPLRNIIMPTDPNEISEIPGTIAGLRAYIHLAEGSCCSGSSGCAAFIANRKLRRGGNFH